MAETHFLAPLPSPIPADRLEGTCPADGNLLGDGGFASDLEGWKERYGLLRNTDKTYVGEPGAGLLVTNDTAPDGGQLAVTGKCVDLVSAAAGEGHTDGQTMTVEAYLLAMPETESLSLSVFFHADAGCRGEVLEVAGPPAVTSESGWTFVTQSFSIPRGAAAADFVIRAVSQSDTGRALVDRACAYHAPVSG